jgi:hypothetical protein
MGQFKPRPKPESNYLSKSEKLLLAEEGVIFPLNSVEFQEGQGYEGADRFVVTTEIEGEEKRMSFGVSKTGNESSRDRLLADVEEYLANDGEDEILVAAELISTGKGNPLLSLYLVDEEGNRIEVEEEDTEAEPEPEEEEEKPVKKVVAKKTAAKRTTAKRTTAKRK